MYLTLYRDTHAGREIITGVAYENVRFRPRLWGVNVLFKLVSEQLTCDVFRRIVMHLLFIWALTDTG